MNKWDWPFDFNSCCSFIISRIFQTLCSGFTVIVCVRVVIKLNVTLARGIEHIQRKSDYRETHIGFEYCREILRSLPLAS